LPQRDDHLKLAEPAALHPYVRCDLTPNTLAQTRLGKADSKEQEDALVGQSAFERFDPDVLQLLADSFLKQSRAVRFLWVQVFHYGAFMRRAFLVPVCSHSAVLRAGLPGVDHDMLRHFPDARRPCMNDRIKMKNRTILSDNWYTLNKYSFEYRKDDGEWELQHREAYDRGNGATILLYDPDTTNVILTRQFRLPSYVNGNKDGMLIEACAGLLDNDNPEDCIRKETEEETGFKIDNVEKVFETYMSPGSVTEILHFFVARYRPDMKISDGGGLAHEQENIEVLELKFDAAFDMIKSGEIRDAKTVMLLQYAKLNNLL